MGARRLGPTRNHSRLLEPRCDYQLLLGPRDHLLSLRSNTGPSGDHTPAAGGKYMYTETSTFTAGTSTILTSPAIDLAPLDTPQLSFWYHMYGADIAGLTLEVSTERLGPPCGL